MNDNRALKLLEAFSGVEEDLLERCEQVVVEENAIGAKSELAAKEWGKVISLTRKLREKFQKNSWRYGSAAAAVFCVVAVGFVCMNGVYRGNDAAFEKVMEDAAEVFTSGTNGAGVPETTMRQEVGTTSASDKYAYTADADFLQDAGVKAELPEFEERKQESVVDSTSNLSNQGVAESVKGPSTNSESTTSEDGISDGVPMISEKKITEKEARTHEVFGAYVPTKLPKGYGLESAYVSEVSGDTLVMSWTRGMDSILIRIYTPKEKPAVVDISKPETYDEYLYEIPHAETVPKEYWDTFQNPVCAWEDFCLEFVQKRMIEREDVGDTDTPRGSFSVLYPDGVVIYFNGRGTAEEIWELFDSMEVK